MKSKVRVKKFPEDAIKQMDDIARSFKGPDSVKVGLPKGSNPYPDGTSVILVGAVHEFGSPARGVPQRSYLRSTVVENKSKYKQEFRKLSKQIISGKIDTKKALNIIGLTVQSDVQNKLRSIKTPPLKYREGNPLIDTGHLIQSITYKVGL